MDEHERAVRRLRGVRAAHEPRDRRVRARAALAQARRFAWLDAGCLVAGVLRFVRRAPAEKPSRRCAGLDRRNLRRRRKWTSRGCRALAAGRGWTTGIRTPAAAPPPTARRRRLRSRLRRMTLAKSDSASRHSRIAATSTMIASPGREQQQRERQRDADPEIDPSESPVAAGHAAPPAKLDRVARAHRRVSVVARAGGRPPATASGTMPSSRRGGGPLTGAPVA